MKPPAVRHGTVDRSHRYFEIAHSLLKETVARFGRDPAGTGLALQFIHNPTEHGRQVRQDVTSDVEAKLSRLSPQAANLEGLLKLLVNSCSHPGNLYTEIHWCPFEPGLTEP